MNLSDLVPNLDDASPDEVYQAFTETAPNAFTLDERGDIVINPMLTEDAVFYLGVGLMRITLRAVNALRRQRKAQATRLEQLLAGEIPDATDEYVADLLITIESLERGVADLLVALESGIDAYESADARAQMWQTQFRIATNRAETLQHELDAKASEGRRGW